MSEWESEEYLTVSQLKNEVFGSLIPVPQNTICVFILLTLFLKAKEIWTMRFQYSNWIPNIMCAQSNKVINKPLPLKSELLSKSGRENLDSCMRVHVVLHRDFYAVIQRLSILCVLGLCVQTEANSNQSSSMWYD